MERGAFLWALLLADTKTLASKAISWFGRAFVEYLQL